MCAWHDYTSAFRLSLAPPPQVKVQQNFISSWLCVSMSPFVMGAERQLDVPVTKLSILSDNQIHHTEMGTDPCKHKPTTLQIHTNMQINYKINITLQTSDPSMTSFSAAQHWHSNTNQPLRQREWWNAVLSSSCSPSPCLYHSHTVSPWLVPICHFYAHFLQIYPLTKEMSALALFPLISHTLSDPCWHFCQSISLYFQSLSFPFKCLFIIIIIS